MTERNNANMHGTEVENVTETNVSGATDGGREHPSHRKKGWFWPWFWRTFLVVSLAYAWYSFYVPANGITWAKDYAAAETQASTAQQPMILFFTGEWCVPCRIMKRQVWADDDVEAIVNKSFTPVAIYREDPAASELFTRYSIRSTPTTVVVTNDGEVLEQVKGRMEKADFLDLLERHQ